MSQYYFEIDKYSHHFTLTRISARGRELIVAFAKPYFQWGMVREGRFFKRQVIKRFTTCLKDSSQYRFHIEQYSEFIKYLRDAQVHECVYVVREHVPSTGILVNMAVKEGWVPRDYQIPIIQYCISPEPVQRKLVEIQTGKGKTSIAMMSIGQLGVRLGIFLKPQFMEKWASDVCNICQIKPEEVMQINGSSELMKLINLAKTGGLDKIKVIIISNKTMQNWITLYESVGDDGLEMLGYDCLPQELLPVLGIGVRLIDEVHMDFHLNFKIDLYTHVARSISLSATLVADDPFLTRMYELAYPKSMRYSGLAYHKYIKAYSWIYRFNKPELIRTSEFGQKTYSHNAFEKSVLKRPSELNGYLKMIDQCMKETYVQSYQKGDRLLIYCSSINMCGTVAKYLKSLPQYKHLVINRYVEDDPYNNLLNSDVCVSTLQSAGTGHDIPKLTTVILTSAVSSTQANIQGSGRLREIPGRDVKFIYFVCSDIPKHIDYHEKKKLILKQTAFSYNSLSYPHYVG